MALLSTRELAEQCEKCEYLAKHKSYKYSILPYLAAFVLPVDGDASALGPGGEHLGERGESGELLQVYSMIVSLEHLLFLGF